jgi:hypothetical protein
MTVSKFSDDLDAPGFLYNPFDSLAEYNMIIG